MNKESRSYNSVRNTFWALLGQAVIIILNFVSKAIFINVLGNEYNGVNGLFSNILSLLSLAELGIGTSMIYTYYKPIKENDYNKLGALIGFYRKIYRLVVAVIAIAGLILLPFVDWFVETKQSIDNLKWCYLIYLFNTISSYLFVYKTDIIAANQKRYILTKIDLRIKIVRIIVQIIALIITHNFLLYLLIEVIFNFSSNIYSSFVATKMYPYISINEELPKNEKKNIISNLKSTAVYKVSTVLMNSTDNIIISKLLSTIWVGLYSNYYMIINALINILTMINNSICASVGNILTYDNKEKNKEIMDVLTYFFLWFSMFTTICLCVLLNDFVTLWIGEENILSPMVVGVIVANHYLYFSNNAVVIFRETGGLFKETKYVTLIAAIVNLFLSILLGNIMGLAGVLIATFIARLFVRYAYETYIVYRKLMRDKIYKYIIKQIMAAGFTIATAFITFFITSFIDSVSWITLFVKILICLIVPNTLFLLLTFKRKEFMFIFKKIKSIIT